MEEVKRCASYVRMLQGLVPKLPRPITSQQNGLIHQGYLRAAICLGKAGRCQDAWRHFRNATAVYYGSSPQTEAQARQYLRTYAKGCPDPGGSP